LPPLHLCTRVGDDCMNVLYPQIEPYDRGMLDVGDRNRIYWEACGNQGGKPVVVLHGGPGSGCTPRFRRFFDPSSYHIIQFNQRGCGRSRPHASDISTDLSVNTTWHLLADIELLRERLEIDRWMIFGGSWGSTLGLLYAETYPLRVSEIIFWGVAMTRPAEIDWLYHGVAPLFPGEWARFLGGIQEPERTFDLLDVYFQRLNSPNPAVRFQAARDFHAWEFALFSAANGETPSEVWQDPDFQVARARICTHYFRNTAWLEDGILLRNADRLSGIPGIMVHGRLDLGSPLRAAWELNRAWPDSELVVISSAGHSTSDAGMEAALVAATNHWAQR
jgi:proline iminopeptidase